VSARRLTLVVEAVEKVPKQIFGRDVERNDLTECTMTQDLMFGKGQVTPENVALTPPKDFSYRLVMCTKNQMFPSYVKTSS